MNEQIFMEMSVRLCGRRRDDVAEFLPSGNGLLVDRDHSPQVQRVEYENSEKGVIT